MLTALGGKAQVVRGLQAGADDYLTKPFDLDELDARIKIAERILNLQENLTTSRRQMEVLAMQDTLTGLLNRRAIHDLALSELNRLKRGTAAEPLSVIMLDVDHFKDINDAFGHEAGDQVLQFVAGLLAKELRSYDGLGRWGGEEFLMLLPGTGLDEARAVAERIRAAMEQARPVIEAAAAQCSMSASLGVACIESFDPAGDPSGERWLDGLGARRRPGPVPRQERRPQSRGGGRPGRADARAAYGRPRAGSRGLMQRISLGRPFGLQTTHQPRGAGRGMWRSGW